MTGGGAAAAHSDFDLKRVVTDFGLTRAGDTNLSDDVAPLPPGDVLRDWLAEYVPLATTIGTEAARSQYLITPILAEARRQAGGAFNVMPGIPFDVDRGRGLVGVCDYLVTRSREIYYVKSSVAAVVEAKREDLTAGIGRCAAEMVAVRLFNEREGDAARVVHGCVTTGSLWKFLRLDGANLAIDPTEYGLGELPKVLGILVHIGRD